jgi:ppGpp synthetase/RelA/SpoT-type nucleotidyltranferase
VFYKDDVPTVSAVLERYFRHVERQEHVPDSYWEFGYFGSHWIFALPDDVIPRDVDKDAVPRFFEFQVKTLFQHAWSEANHDLGYKASQALSPDQQRRFAFTAAQAWGADRVFNELRTELEVP